MLNSPVWLLTSTRSHVAHCCSLTHTNKLIESLSRSRCQHNRADLQMILPQFVRKYTPFLLQLLDSGLQWNPTLWTITKRVPIWISRVWRTIDAVHAFASHICEHWHVSWTISNTHIHAIECRVVSRFKLLSRARAHSNALFPPQEFSVVLFLSWFFCCSGVRN